MIPAERAAQRGVPSLTWGPGQARRLELMRQSTRLEAARVLVDGCGVGMYMEALQAFTTEVYGLDIEESYLREAQARGLRLLVAAAAEALPYPDNTFDIVLSHEVIEHVADDRQAVAEMVRVLRPGGRILLFCPNRWFPFETHGHYWRGRYHFGNTPLINYLPDPLRNRLAPHVRAYSGRALRRLFAGLPVRIVHHTRIFPAFDRIMRRHPRAGRLLRRMADLLERTPLNWLGLSHFIVVEKTP
ncbi:MAG: class I SAM-dependent methyltransferase [Anaerolineae bacterium]|nr:class I SAM-dependent methyltransferase [Anaerolineae bacterium]